MKKQNKDKSYFLFKNNNVSNVILGFIIIFSADAYCIIMVSHSFGTARWDGSAVLSLLLLAAPFIIIPCISWKHRLMVRCLMRCRFDEIGIHCYYILWGSFTMKWDEIRTYGSFVSKAGYVSMGLMFLSKDPHELYDRKKLYEISKERLIFEYRPGFWEAFVEFMPKDIMKRLDESISSGRDCYVKR